MANGSSSPGRISGQQAQGTQSLLEGPDMELALSKVPLVTQGVSGSGSARAQAGFTEQFNSLVHLPEPTSALLQPSFREAGTTLGSSKSAWGKEFGR